MTGRVLEREIEAYLVRELGKRGGEAIKFEDPRRNGAPDRIVLLPGGRVVFVEVKREGGKVSPHQAAYMRHLRLKGFWVVVTWSKQDVDDLVWTLQNEGFFEA